MLPGEIPEGLEDIPGITSFDTSPRYTQQPLPLFELAPSAPEEQTIELQQSNSHPTQVNSEPIPRQYHSQLAVPRYADRRVIYTNPELTPSNMENPVWNSSLGRWVDMPTQAREEHYSDK